VRYTRLGSREALQVAALLVGVAACGGEYPTTKGERSLVVHGMLAEGDAAQEIILEYTRHLNEGIYRGLTPASGARITVSGSAEHHFTEDPHRLGVYVASFVPAAGEHYLLRIDGPRGERVTGDTRIPGVPHVISPRSDTTLTLGSFVTVQWSASEAAAAYVLVDAAPGEPSSLTALWHPPILGDTSVTLQPGRFGGTALHLRIAAVDSNYAAYHRTGSFAPEQRSRIRTTVDGAYGLFGAYAISERRTLFVR
jgi:hypothetical protein